MANFSNDLWMASTAAAFYPHTIDQSLRFEDGDSPRLTRTPSSAGNRKTWTWSAWVKRGNISTSQYLFQSYDGSSAHRSAIKFNSNDTIAFDQGGNTSSGLIDTVAVYRDVSSFYHIVVVADYSNGTAGNRAKIYVNGVLQTVTTTDDFENANGIINSTNEHNISFASNNFFDGYMSEVNFIDGTALTADSFGETKDGIWVPKDVSGLNFGTNGFHLDFADSNTIGNDISGNDNDFTVSGLVASDVVPDSPTDVYCTWSPVDRYHSGSPVWSEGNTKFRSSTTSWTWTAGTIDMIWGEGQKFAFKFKYNAALTGSSFPLPFISSRASLSTNRTDVTPGKGTGTHNALQQDVTNGVSDFVFNKSTNGSTTQHSQFTSGFSVGDAYEYLVDLENETLTVKDEGGTTRLDAFDISFLNDGSNLAIGASAYNYNNLELVTDFTPSIADYNLLSTANLLEPAIIDASEYFNTVLYDGSDVSQSITAVGFQPDWVWIKVRDHNFSNALYDSVRGTELRVLSNTIDAEQPGGLTSFDSNGFTLNSVYGTDTDSGKTYVAWNWKAGGSAVSNSDGTITSSVSANTKSGFSVVSFTHDGTNASTIGHGLGETPTMIIMKQRSASSNWRVFHAGLADGKNIQLNITNAVTQAGDIFQTAPTNTVFTSGNGDGGSGKTYIAYCFTDIDQYLKTGVYKGNGNTDGTYVHLGFRPAWILTKRTDSSSNWNLLDATRSTSNVMQDRIKANGSDAEDTSRDVDFLSNGFKWRESGSDVNNGTYIYLAFAEQPIKYSNAR